MSAEAGPSQTRSTAFSRWRDSVADLTGLGLSDNQKSEAAKAEAERQKMANDWDRCEEWKQKLMTQSPIVTFMLKHLELAGCKFTPASIQCYPCPEDLAAQSGFHPDYGVMLCQNRTHLPTKAYAESALTHELMHAFDYCRFKMDFNNVRHHACSEIRASNLSGECRWIREQQRKIYGFTKHHQACVKRRAATSIMNNPTFEGMDQQTKRAAAEKVVNEVWESCSKDTRPFDEIY